MAELQNGNPNLSLNNFKRISQIPHIIIEKLMLDESQDAQNFWKALVYTEVECLTRDNLTLSEKLDLFWQGQPHQEQFKIFNKPLISNSLTDSSSMTHLRIYRVDSQPTTKNESVLVYEFDIVTNESDNSLRDEDGYFVEKTDYIESKLLTLLNGIDLGVGSGYLIFDKGLSRSCGSMLSINNSLNFYGRRMFLGLRLHGTSNGGIC